MADRTAEVVAALEEVDLPTIKEGGESRSRGALRMVMLSLPSDPAGAGWRGEIADGTNSVT
jgi:hypothetical protein